MEDFRLVGDLLGVWIKNLKYLRNFKSPISLQHPSNPLKLQPKKTLIMLGRLSLCQDHPLYKILCFPLINSPSSGKVYIIFFLHFLRFHLQPNSYLHDLWHFQHFHSDVFQCIFTEFFTTQKKNVFKEHSWNNTLQM